MCPRERDLTMSIDHSFRIGALVYEDGQAPEEIMREVARRLRADGTRLGGVIQRDEEVPGRQLCDMILDELAGGRRILVSEFRGSGAQGCRLDESALAEAAAAIQASLRVGIDLMMINKFGKTEAEGRGLLPVIAEAVSRDVPVLIGVPRRNLQGWRGFAADLAGELPLDVAATLSWCREAARAGGPRMTARTP